MRVALAYICMVMLPDSTMAAKIIRTCIILIIHKIKDSIHINQILGICMSYIPCINAW